MIKEEEVSKTEQSAAIDSDFSASFYGPLFTEPKEHFDPDGYKFVRDTHTSEYDHCCAANKIRYYLMTNTDKMKNICLHRAAKFGDKQFTTMLIMETEELDKLQPGG